MENKKTKANEPIQIFVPNSTDPNLSDVVKSALCLSALSQSALSQSNGLTKREYFAALALQGMLAKYGSDYQVQNAKEAIYWADALIEELNKPPQN